MNIVEKILALILLMFPFIGLILAVNLYRDGRKILHEGTIAADFFKDIWPGAEKALAKAIGYFLILCAASALFVSGAFRIQMIVALLSR